MSGNPGCGTLKLGQRDTNENIALFKFLDALSCREATRF